MFKFQREKCTEPVTGTLVDYQPDGLKQPAVIVVSYYVGETEYQIKETVKLRSEAIKVGVLPIGQRKFPKIGDTTIGRDIEVLYNKQDPSMAYIRDNVGIMNE